MHGQQLSHSVHRVQKILQIERLRRQRAIRRRVNPQIPIRLEKPSKLIHRRYRRHPQTERPMVGTTHAPVNQQSPRRLQSHRHLQGRGDGGIGGAGPLEGMCS
jgi:hypothetical protein